MVGRLIPTVPNMKMLSLLFASATLLAQAPQGELPLGPGGDIGQWPMPPEAPDNASATTPYAPPASETTPPIKPVPEHLRSVIADGRLDQVLFDVPEADGPLWALGTNYKASFGSDRWTFIAKPATTAAAAQPLTFRLVHARVGGQALELVEDRPVRRDGNRVRLDRGVLVESLDLELMHLEQTFTFTTLPQRDELTLQIALRTELAAQQVGTGLRFFGAATDINYSGAIAIDAEGNRIEAPTRLIDGHIEIRVPAPFVATARLPLIIDPLIASGTVVTGSVDVGNPDVVWAPATNSWHVCYQQTFAANDWDCYVRRMSDTFTAIGSATAVDFTSASWFRPRIAHLTNHDRSMVVVEERTGTNPARIRGRIVDGLGAIATSQFSVATATVDNLVPDIGGDAAPITSYFTVVWANELTTNNHDIQLRQVTHLGALRGTSATSVLATAANETNPSISKSCGVGTLPRHAVVYQQLSGSNWNILGSLFTRDGVLLTVGGSNSFPIDTTSAQHTFPSVSSPTRLPPNGPRRFLCTYDSLGSSFDETGMTGFSATGVVLVRGTVAPLSWLSLGPIRFSSVDCDGMRFAVGFNSGSGLNISRIATVSIGNGELLPTDVHIMGYLDPPFALQVASKYSSTGIQDPTYAVVYDVDTSTALRIGGARYNASPYGGLLTRQTSCGGGVTISGVGDPLPGTVTVFSLTASAPIAGISVGNANNATIPGCNCILGVDPFLTTIGTILLVPIPDDLTILGTRLSFQGFMLGAPGTSCLGNIHLSDTIDMVVR
jgi:hypothetical protein